MRRREFMTFLGGVAATWPFAVQAQQQMPVVGFLSPARADGFIAETTAFRQGLRDIGYFDGQNVRIEFSWAEGQYERLVPLAANLVRQKVDVIVASGADSAFAAKAATTSIPIVFNTASDPVGVGLVTSLARPGSNLTGVTRLSVELLPKRLELLGEVVPNTTSIGLLVNPEAKSADKAIRDVESAARKIGRNIKVLNAGSEREIDTVFEVLSESRPDALLIATNQFFSSVTKKLAALSVRHAIPTVYQSREFTADGGLMAYGPNDGDAYKLLGDYVGRVLKGAKPADLPVTQLARIELVINLKTAKTLGLTMPASLLSRADEVIE